MGNERLIRLSAREEYRLVEAVSALVAAGVRLPEAYDAVTGAAAAGAAAAGIAAALRRGCTTHAATVGVVARIHPVHAAMLRVTDETGRSVPALEGAARFLRTRLDLREKAWSAALYPLVVIALTLIGAALLVIVVIPGTLDLLEEAGVAVTPATAGSHALLVSVAAVTICAAVFTVLLFAPGGSARDEALPEWVDRLRLRYPVIGRLEGYRDLLGLAHALAGFCEVGVPIDRALRGGALCVANRSMRSAVEAAADRVRGGVPPSSALAFTLGRYAFVARWFALAEGGVALPLAMRGMASFVESEFTRLSMRVAALVEPLFVAAAGAVLLVVVLTVVAPMIELFARVFA